ncbi:MAG: AmmeMemoRadiSam system radical SAM enzyme [Candidatus Omnitrophica bacterium]|nr:AmmeMemoRadiSam system radical SAM enzyme [Candidatus Omnitrophota bacterium]
MKEALFYEPLTKNGVHCYLCNHRCKIADGKFGFCGVRKNERGVLYTLAYGKVIAAHIDPIEKKPLYHFLPGSYSFSIATIGCNFRCGFCQNWQISQSSFKNGDAQRSEELSPEQIVDSALKNKCRSISYTYTEPTIFFEYAFDTAKLAKEKGLYNNFVTNGYMTTEALGKIRPYLDAANVDLKFFKESSYEKICSGRLRPVLDSIKFMKQSGIWVEVTTLVVPGENDSEEELRDIAEFIAGVDKNIPWHISAFHPNYKFTDYHATPEDTLKRAFEIGKSCGLNYIYIGNVVGFGNDTFCHNCKKLLIKRELFSVTENKIIRGKCTFCGAVIPGIFE